jgi:hypothetical protein
MLAEFAAPSRAASRFRWLAVALALTVAGTVQAMPVRRGIALFTATQPRDTLFTLPVTWVVLDSVKVYRNGEWVSEFVDWRLADPGNRIWLYRALGAGDTLRVEYLYQPFPLLRSYARRSLREIVRVGRAQTPVTDTSRVVAAPSSGDALFEGWNRLTKSGSLVRSVQIGTGQDLQLESALNLQVQGRVGRNVDVVAALTDQSTPIQAEGTTETLSELDKIFVSVRTPHLGVTLGDYALDLSGGNYDAYSRKLTGILGEASYGGVKAAASAAVSRGQFSHYSFQGQEANQGPYPLPGRNGEIGIIVLSGTEKVWLDGRLLRRGEGNDYVINYSSGEITFTSQHIITADSRIVVDYEYASEDYERIYGAGRFEGAFADNRYGGSITWITEADDRTRPVNLGFTDKDRSRLAAAGDNPDSAVVFTADSLGARKGDYVHADTLVNDSTFSIFVFVSPDSQPNGQWQVSFDDFGVGHGDYEAAADSAGRSYFRWVGPNLGRYRPYRRLPLPKRNDLADFRFHAIPVTGLTLSGELAASGRDLNTFSLLDDQNNNGAAYAGALNFSRQRLNLFGVKPYSLVTDLSVRHRDARFVEISRVPEIEFQREWDANLNAGSAETIREGSLQLSPIRALSLAGSYGDLSRPQQFASRRRTANMGLNLGAWNLSASHLALQSEDDLTGRRGDWIRQSLRGSGQISRFAPRAGLDRERKTDRYGSNDFGFRFLDYFGGMRATLPADLSWDGEFRQRLDDALASSGNFNHSATATTVSSEAAWHPAEGGQTTARFTHREKTFASRDSANVTSDVGRLESLIAPRSRWFEANAIYEVAKTRSQNQILIAVKVPDGTGSYRQVGNQYVPDDQGDYILVPRDVGSYSPATELSANALFWLRPDEIAVEKVGNVLHALSSETEIVIDERTRRALNAGLLLFDQSQYRGDSTLQGSLSLREDVHVLRLSSKLAWRARYRYSQSLLNQFLNGGQFTTTREGGLRARARYWSAWRGETEIVMSRQTLRYAAGTVPDRDINRTELSQSNVVTLSPRWEVGADLRAVETKDERTATQVSLRELRPHAALTMFGKGRVDGDFTWTHASSNKGAVPYELGSGANRGENLRWSLRGAYQFGQNFSGSLSYTGRRDAGEKTFHTGRLDVRATF